MGAALGGLAVYLWGGKSRSASGGSVVDMMKSA
jgi:hypothetical protein